MRAGRDLAALHTQLHTLEETRRALAARLQVTLTALALTLDAESSTQLCIDESFTHRRPGDRGRWESLQRQQEAERYRAVLRLLATAGDDPAVADG